MNSLAFFPIVIREPLGGLEARWIMEIRCEEVQKKLADYKEHRLVHPEKGMIERHLFYCPDCIFHLALITANSLDREEEKAGYKR